MPTYPAAPPVTFDPPAPRFPARRPPSSFAGRGAPYGRQPSNPPAQAEMPRPSAVRGAAPEDPPPPPPAPAPIPTPEELGVAPAAPPPASQEAPAPPAAAPVDWARTRTRLRELGAVSFQLEGLPQGRCRFACWLPGPGGRERVEAQGGSEAEAVQLCLEKAARWKADRR